MNRTYQNIHLQPHLLERPPLSQGRTRTDASQVELAILKTSAYADIFDYPLTAQEIHFYLIGVKASPDIVASTLKNSRGIKDFMEQSGGFFTLKGREAIVETRRSRSKVAERLKPKAVRYGSWIARFPFVRMVALTGALAVGNVQEGADIDFLIVTENERVWTCRALILLLVRLAALRGDRICPNYYLSERSMSFSQPDLYTAHEIAQMVPIAGMETYRRMRELNPWTLQFLPNATGPNHLCTSISKDSQSADRKGNFEGIFSLPFFMRLERWEMERKIRKFQKKYTSSNERSFDEAAFAPDWCKGHFDGHRQRTLDAYNERLSRFDHE